MKLLFIVLAAAVFSVACINNAVEPAAVKSVDSATAAAPDTIKAPVVDTTVKGPGDKATKAPAKHS
jgi:PBP1b-binding outer membrane lipoprotein LpoB